MPINKYFDNIHGKTLKFKQRGYFAPWPPVDNPIKAKVVLLRENEDGTFEEID
jgi:hypothetical protein